MRCLAVLLALAATASSLIILQDGKAFDTADMLAKIKANPQKCGIEEGSDDEPTEEDCGCKLPEEFCFSFQNEIEGQTFEDVECREIPAECVEEIASEEGDDDDDDDDESPEDSDEENPDDDDPDSPNKPNAQGGKGGPNGSGPGGPDGAGGAGGAGGKGNCCYWASCGECAVNPAYMVSMCKEECGTPQCSSGNFKMDPMCQPKPTSCNAGGKPAWCPGGAPQQPQPGQPQPGQPQPQQPWQPQPQQPQPQQPQPGPQQPQPQWPQPQRPQPQWPQPQPQPQPQWPQPQPQRPQPQPQTRHQSPQPQPGQGGACMNENKLCTFWATKHGECQKNPNYMLLKCRKACRVC